MVYLFDGHGNTTFGNETTEMREGMLKFNIEVIVGQRTVCRHSSQVKCFVMSMQCNYNRFSSLQQEFTHGRLTTGNQYWEKFCALSRNFSGGALNDVRINTSFYFK